MRINLYTSMDGKGVSLSLSLSTSSKAKGELEWRMDINIEMAEWWRTKKIKWLYYLVERNHSETRRISALNNMQTLHPFLPLHHLSWGVPHGFIYSREIGIGAAAIGITVDLPQTMMQMVQLHKSKTVWIGQHDNICSLRGKYALFLLQRGRCPQQDWQ